MRAKESFVAGTSGFIEPTTVTRLLVVSFFIALSLGLISGVEVRLLAAPFISDPYASYIMQAMVLVLSLMILVGFHRRRAALVLALIVFWPSYMMLFAGGDVSAFWRDLALIGGLVMSASDHQKVVDELPETELSEVVVDLTPADQVSAKTPEPTEDDAYREDFNLARSY